jgi:hypothetical protein
LINSLCIEADSSSMVFLSECQIAGVWDSTIQI